MDTKICKTCGNVKSLLLFDIARKSKDGRWNVCKECRSTSPNYQKRRQEREELFKIGKRRCTDCGEIKIITLFVRDKHKHNGYSSICLVCNCERSKEAQQSESYKKWREEYVKGVDWTKYYPQMAIYKKANRKKISKKQLIYLHDHIEVRLKNDMRTYTRRVLLKGGAVRIDKYAVLLGCDGDFLREYLESLWTEGMNWSNYGQGKNKWNMDHIIPCAYFNLKDSEQQKICFHWTNLQPMWSVPNMSKGSLYQGKRHFHYKEAV